MIKDFLKDQGQRCSWSFLLHFVQNFDILCQTD